MVHKVISSVLTVIIAIVAIALGVLAVNQNLKNLFFSKLAVTLLLKDQPLDKDRCDLFRNVKGRVLEIGPGPGTNFRCWSENRDITEWVGVEPNTYFQDLLAQEKLKKNITFPTRTVWLKGENVDVEPESFDVVVGAHVLCSVDDVAQVVYQVKRALKPNGEYIFMEHVAEKDLSSWNSFYQQLAQPLITIVGNGCKFKALWNDLNENSLLKGFHVTSKELELPMSLPFFSPHLIGAAKKLK